MKLFVFNLLGAWATIHLSKTALLQTSDSDYDTFSGTMSVSSEDYEVYCDCTDQGIVEIEEVKCSPSKIKLSQESEGSGTSYQTMQEYLSSNTNYTYAKITHSSFRCLDGRIQDEILGTPGGDAGEFILGLLEYQDLLETSFNETYVFDVLQEYLRCMETNLFYMCTDQTAIDHAQKELALSELDIYSPDESIQDELLDALTEPENIGDTHIRLLVGKPEMYSINSTLVKYFIRSYYKTLWDSNNTYSESLYLDVLQDSHKETAFLEVKVNDECINELVAPLVAPSNDTFEGVSLLINHVNAVIVRRAQIAAFIAEKIDQGEHITSEQLFKRIKHHGLLFLDVTGSYVSKDLPFFTAEFV